MEPLYIVIAAILALIVGTFIGYIYRKKISENRIGSAEDLANKIIDDANKAADSKKKEILLEAKDEIHKMREEQDAENKARVSEIKKMENRLQQKEEHLDKKSDQIEKKNDSLTKNLKRVEDKEKQVDTLIENQEKELIKISELTKDQAKELIIEKVREDAEHDTAVALREYELKLQEDSKKMAKEVVTSTIQRYASDYVAESTVSVVSLPNDEMKGRIIGREGRNIRAFESLTGVDLIIDDTPEAVVLSSFNPVRRHIAKVTLEKLILDGRIHPTRIEEMLEKATEEVDEQIREAGMEALDAVGIHNVHPELVKLLGRMKYRTSYGQNVLGHTIEVANIAGLLAKEIGANEKIAKRGGLFHDIGKAVDFEQEGTHIEIGVKILKKYKESKEVINCSEAHHGDVPFMSIEAMLVQAADAISASRPGARRESIENYIKRLEELEEIANSFDGVDSSFAIQAGREVRIMIQPEKINEDKMTILAHDIAKKIENDLDYPGQIKVNLIRETRATEYAK